MYSISNSNLKEVIKLLGSLQGLTGSDDKTVNAKRRAKIMIKSLEKKKTWVTNQ